MIAIAKKDWHMLKYLLTKKKWYELEQAILEINSESIQIDESNLSDELWKKFYKLLSLGILQIHQDISP